MRGRIIKLLVLMMIVVSVASVVAYHQLQSYLDKPLRIADSGMQYTLNRGGSLSSLAYSLASQGVLSHPRWLIAYGRITGKGIDIKAGEYHFETGLTPRALLSQVEQGDVIEYEVTLVEGWTLAQAFSHLQQQPKLKKTLGENWREKLSDLLSDANVTYPVLEGLFFPDTYHYHSQLSDEDILRQANRRLRSVLHEQWQQRSLQLPYDDPYQALIMASLVEKETGQPSERSQIAGVFVRRLQQGMRLQTDPTVIYGLGDAFNGNLRTVHLRDSSNPYNTYRHRGLPPSPIALVGREAIHAALHPADGETLYFVAKGDGSHHFSKTLQEHQRAVRKYQIVERRKDYSSAPKLNQTRQN